MRKGQLAGAAAIVAFAALFVPSAIAAGVAERIDCDDSSGPSTEDEVNPSLAGGLSSETYTCSLTDAAGNPVTNTRLAGEVQGNVNDVDVPDGASYALRDYVCTTGEDGTCQVTVTQAENEVGLTTICFYLETEQQGLANCPSETFDETSALDGSDVANDLGDTVRLAWIADGPVADGLDVEPESGTAHVGHYRTLTATVYDQFGNPFLGETLVNFDYIGSSQSPGSPEGTCTTAASATCSFSYTLNQIGTNYICVWTGTTPWLKTIGPDACDEETSSDADDEAGVFDPPSPADDVDVVAQSWQESGHVPRYLDCDVSGSPATEESSVPSASGDSSEIQVLCRVTGSDHTPVGGFDFTINGETAGPVNDPDTTDGTSFDSPDYTCNTGNDGTCAFEVTQVDGEPGTSTICFYVGAASDGASLCAAEPYDEGLPATPSETGNDFADAVRLTWLTRSAEGGGVDAETEYAQRKLGHKYVVSARVFDQFGSALAGDTTVSFEFFSGSRSDRDGNTPGTPDRICTTRGTSTCSLAYTTRAPAGPDLLCVWTNAAPAMTGTAQSGTCDGEARDDYPDNSDVFDLPSPAHDDVDVVGVVWRTGTPAGGSVDAETESASRQLGTKHSLTSAVFDDFGAAHPGTTVVNFEFFSGSPSDLDGNTPATPDRTCTTPGTTTCSIAYTRRVGAGTDLVCVWTNSTPVLDGTNSGGTCDGESWYFDGDYSGSFDALTPGDDVDVVKVIWQAPISRRLVSAR